VEQVCDHHVAIRPDALVEAGAIIDGQRLGNVDLHVIDVVFVPDRFEHSVGEPQRDQVLHGLAAKEVVDAEHPLLRHHAVHQLVELAGGLEIYAEWLLQHHPRSLRQA
jgi:hypothetical protein